MGAINTQVVDLTLIVLSLFIGTIYARKIYKRQRFSVKMIPLFLIWSAGFWCLFNWIGHLLAVLYVNIGSMINGTFTYSFYFYSLIFMGVAFMLLSLLQLKFLKKMSQHGLAPYPYLKQVSALIIILSIPIIPLNPIGLLPVISSAAILTTVAVTKKSWVLPAKPEKEPFITPQAA